MSVELLNPPRDVQKVVGRVTARAMTDVDFRELLEADPSSILAEHGLDLPPDIQVEILKSFEDIPGDRSDETMYLVVPDAEDMSHEDLAMLPVASASCETTASTACTTPSCVSTASSASTNSCN